jgi:hypothetical protein
LDFQGGIVSATGGGWFSEKAQQIAAHESPRTTKLYYAQRVVMLSRFRKCLPVPNFSLDYCT